MFVDANVKKETIPAKQNQSVGRNSHGYSVFVIWSVRGKRFCKQVGIPVPLMESRQDGNTTVVKRKIPADPYETGRENNNWRRHPWCNCTFSSLPWTTRWYRSWPSPVQFSLCCPEKFTMLISHDWNNDPCTGYMHKLTSVNSGYQVTSDNSYLFSIHTVNNLVLNLWNDFSFSSKNGRLFGVGYSVKFRAISSWGGDSAKDFFWPNDVFDIHCDKKNHRMGTWAGWWLQ